MAALRASTLTSVLCNLAPRFGEGFVPELAERVRSGSGELPGAPCAKAGCAEWGLRTDWQAEPGGRTGPSLRGNPRCRGRDAAGLQGASRPRAELRGTRPGRFADNDPGSPRRRPSQPAGKPISHSGRQSPEAQRFVPRGPGPLSLALITLSRLTAPPAAPRTPVPRRPPHNGSGNRPRWGPG